MSSSDPPVSPPTASVLGMQEKVALYTGDGNVNAGHHACEAIALTS